MLIAIDGPSGVGKTSVAKRLADIFGLKAVSTGALYRAVAFAVIKSKTNIYDTNQLKKLLQKISLNQKYSNGRILTFLNGEDITQHLESPEVSDVASKVAATKEVRAFLLDIQRSIAGDDAVVEGRDIGSVVLPYADVKIFLDANLQERAKRRFEQMKKAGIEVAFEEVLKELKERDERDRERNVSPLIRPGDAFYIDTTYMSLNEVVNKIVKIVRSITV